VIDWSHVAGGVRTGCTAVAALALVGGGLYGGPAAEHPPLRVRAGDAVLVVFRAEGTSQFSNAAVSGIYMSNVDPDCNFSGYDASPGLRTETDWDYMARLYIHP